VLAGLAGPEIRADAGTHATGATRGPHWVVRVSCTSEQIVAGNLVGRP
jgi:hypothetical protein